MTSQKLTWVRTERYQFSTGHLPRGFGLWTFTIDGTPYSATGTYSTVKALMLKKANEMHATYIYVEA